MSTQYACASGTPDVIPTEQEDDDNSSQEVDGINCHYKGHGNATHFLNACGVFTDKDIVDAYASYDWDIGMNPGSPQVSLMGWLGQMSMRFCMRYHSRSGRR